MHKIAFDTFASNDNKYQLNVNNYSVASGAGSLRGDADSKESEEYVAHKKCSFQISSEARIATWDYLDKSEVVTLLAIDKKSEIRKFLETRIKKQLRGFAKIIFRELMYTVIKFCKKSKFNAEQTGAMMSQFYLTHSFFTNSLDVGAEKLYNYFKDLQLCHSLPFPLRSIKLFSLEETKNNMTFFCKIYLRNLPIIRIMSLPNFSLQANYHLEQDMRPLKKKKKKKDKKSKKDKRAGKQKKK